ncbi:MULTISPECIES: NAD(P)-dependent oxidoreductase [Oceanobacillus]|uniref:NAD(P)-dependent oxidoreductase n=1 Tax=Oceanobacillus TaxID=182709 RepID=UPI0021172982|nr:NAD(P)-dependent oxidoreductase [Oceanobacillus oncorhynchi]MDM8101213.1 NAD(P)-dependent oxidoreductase [Oceanobacillus oncorhynchi]UUI39521.1 NAD(P)-dependent oxidoreductase [Oceanobacillus oncorhynchi]
MNNKNSIGFIGLGVMGFPMASNLLRAGKKLVVFDINAEQAARLPYQERVTIASSKEELAKQVDMVLLMLPNSPHVKEAVTGDGGLIESLPAGALLIDMSSISSTVTKEINKKLEEKNIDMLDAPVSGGQSGAMNGTLTFMVGGKKANYDKALELLQIMGEKIIHCGEVGSGQTVKIVNQLMSAVNLVSMSEGFTLGVKGGVDPEIMREVILNGSGRCWALEDRMPVILDRNFEPGFTVDLHTKDISLALEVGKELQVPLYATSLVHELFKTLQAKGEGGKDNSAVITLYEALAETEVIKRNKAVIQ